MSSLLKIMEHLEAFCSFFSFQGEISILNKLSEFKFTFSIKLKENLNLSKKNSTFFIVLWN